MNPPGYATTPRQRGWSATVRIQRAWCAGALAFTPGRVDAPSPICRRRPGVNPPGA
ncbi:MAG: hypothetical protein R2854_13245 [Caldilineaceae bacterium]